MSTIIDMARGAVPMSFDFDSAIRPDYVVKCSYGNDSIALLQFLHEYNLKHPLGKVVVLYNDTGWATAWWPARVEKGESLHDHPIPCFRIEPPLKCGCGDLVKLQITPVFDCTAKPQNQHGTT